ncbi:MAG: glycosyltransferase family 87 protein [Gemmatales bacterium]
MAGLNRQIPSSRLCAEHPLNWWQRVLLGLLLLGVVVYGLSLAMEANPSKVLQSSLQAGWNVLHDKGMYDEQTRVYRGPPLMAIAAVPFSHSSAEIKDSATVPYPLTRALWFFVNVLCFWLATHWLVNLLNASVGNVPPQRWWLHRLLPPLLLVIPLADSLHSGFADGVLMLVIASLLVTLVRRQFFASGLALAAAVCLQFTSVILVFIPIWRRDRMMPLGMITGLLFTLVLLPGLMFGLQGTNRLNEQYVSVIKKNAFDDQHSPSLIGVIKQGISESSSTRDQWAIALAVLTLVLLTVLTCGLMGFGEEHDPQRLIHFIGALLTIMLLAHPQPALHSCTLLLPSLIGILGVLWNPTTTHRTKSILTVCMAIVFVLITLPPQPSLFPLTGVIVCWLVNIFMLYHSSPARQNQLMSLNSPLAVTSTLSQAA